MAGRTGSRCKPFTFCIQHCTRPIRPKKKTGKDSQRLLGTFSFLSIAQKKGSMLSSFSTIQLLSGPSTCKSCATYFDLPMGQFLIPTSPSQMTNARRSSLHFPPLIKVFSSAPFFFFSLFFSSSPLFSIVAVVKLVICNPDVVYGDKYHLPRFTTGAFLLCLETMYKV